LPGKIAQARICGFNPSVRLFQRFANLARAVEQFEDQDNKVAGPLGAARYLL
jgi:hypothetical protein